MTASTPWTGWLASRGSPGPQRDGPPLWSAWPWAGGLCSPLRSSPFDSTLGYPGEGLQPGHARPDVDLRAHRVLTPAVAARQVRLREFLAHVWLARGLSLDTLLSLPPTDIDRVLSDYGQLLYRAGRSLLDFSETINVMVDCDRGLKGSLPRAWDVAWVWRSLLPAGNRIPIPDKGLSAMVLVALRWGMMTPRLLMSDFPVMFVIIERPKMRRLAARRAYARIDDPMIIAFADAYAARGPPDAFVFDGTYHELRAIFMAICREVGLPVGGADGLSLGSLRPGGATWLYKVTDDSELVRFRGRWSSLRMLEIYIQEVGAASLLPRFAPFVQQRIASFAAAAPVELSRYVDRLNSS